MSRFWTSWESGYYAADGCIQPPIQIWESGMKEHPTDENKTCF